MPSPVSFQRLAATPRQSSNATLVPAPGIQITIACPPFYVIPYCKNHIFQDAPRIRQLPWINDQSSYSKAVPVCNACPHCWRYPKLPDHRFCSIACSLSAARSAPGLIPLPPYHELSIKIATQFVHCWGPTPPPKVRGVYMIRWSESSRKSFEQYRNAVEFRRKFERLGFSPGNEQKRFRSTIRACNLGEEGNIVPCQYEACWLCETVRVGFEPHLERKRSVPWYGCGIRLGAGIYTSHTSAKADKYAKNIHDPDSTVYAMLVCRVVIGRPYPMQQEDPLIKHPPHGYDCVYGQPGAQSAFAEDEYVVYDADAIRAAYLVLYERAPGC